MAHSDIVDVNGQPFKKSQLSQEIAKASITGVRNIWGYNSIADGLTPDYLSSILKDAANGDADAYLTLAEEMEEREMHYASVLGTRKRAVTKLPVLVESYSEDKHDEDLAKIIRDLVAKPEFRTMKKTLMDALSKGYSAVEILWKSANGLWQPQYQWRDPRFFNYDRETGQTLKLKDESNPIDGINLATYKFIVHQPNLKTGLPIRAGLARLVAVSYMCKSYTLTDWLAFAEVFGMPIRVGKYGKNASNDDIATLVNAVANIGTDAAAAIPDTMTIDFVEAKGGSGGADLFKNLAEWLDKQTSKAVLGQTMTTDDGSSNAQANVHNDVRQDIQEDDAADLADTLNRDFVRAYIDINYGVQQHYPKIVIEPIEQEDVKLFAEVIEKLQPVGLRVTEKEVLDRLGLKEPQEGETLFGQHLQNNTDNTNTALNHAQSYKNVEHFPDNGKMGTNHTHDCPTCAKALNKEQPNDAIDDLTDEYLDDWQQQLEPVINPLIKLVREVSTYQELLERLPELQGKMDSDEIVKQLSEAGFKARVIGDEIE